MIPFSFSAFIYLLGGLCLLLVIVALVVGGAFLLFKKWKKSALEAAVETAEPSPWGDLRSATVRLAELDRFGPLLAGRMKEVDGLPEAAPTNLEELHKRFERFALEKMVFWGKLLRLKDIREDVSRKESIGIKGFWAYMAVVEERITKVVEDLEALQVKVNFAEQRSGSLQLQNNLLQADLATSRNNYENLAAANEELQKKLGKSRKRINSLKVPEETARENERLKGMIVGGMESDKRWTEFTSNLVGSPRPNVGKQRGGQKPSASEGARKEA